ncbi:tail completion protein gp17 [Stenotrophomonas sp. PSU-St15]
MIPPIFPLCIASTAVRLAFGDAPTRVYPFGLIEKPPALPYAVWQTVGGSPENYLAQRPDVDALTTQVDVYAKDEASLVEGATALRDAFEPRGYITRWGSQVLDPETKLLRLSFDVDWLVPR